MDQVLILTVFVSLSLMAAEVVSGGYGTFRASYCMDDRSRFLFCHVQLLAIHTRHLFLEAFNHPRNTNVLLIISPVYCRGLSR